MTKIFYSPLTHLRNNTMTLCCLLVATWGSLFIAHDEAVADAGCLYTENIITSLWYAYVVTEPPFASGVCELTGETAYNVHRYWGDCPIGSYRITLNPYYHSEQRCGESIEFCYAGPTDYDCDGDGTPDLQDADQNPHCEGDTCYRELPGDLLLGGDHSGCGSKNGPMAGSGFVGNPINILNGNNFETYSDFDLPTPHRHGLTFQRFYNSQSETMSSLGYGWSHNFALSLEPNVTLDSTTHIKILTQGGGAAYFREASAGNWSGVFGETTTVTVANGIYTWQQPDGSQYGFNSQGQLLWAEDMLGNRRNFIYNANGHLQSLTDQASGRTLTFHYTTEHLLDHISGPVTPAVADGVWCSYGYDTNANLTSVTYADGSGYSYEYNDSNDVHKLTAKRDKQNHLLGSWMYESTGKVILNYTPAGEGVTLTYVDESTVKVTDAYGSTRTYTITKVNNLVPKVTEVAGTSGCQSCVSDMPVRFAYDSDFNTTEEEFANGRVDKYQNYTSNGQPQEIIYAHGSPEERTVTYTYHPNISATLSRTETSVLSATSSKETIWDYDDPDATGDTDTPNENPTGLLYRLIEKGYTKDSNQAVTPYEYVTTYAYNSKGQLTSIDGPLAGSSDTTSYTYDPGSGDLLTETHPLLGTTTYSNHDAAGNPALVTDINGQQTTMTYDGRNRLLSTSKNGVTIATTYNSAGQLQSVTPGTGGMTTYTYDPTYGRLEKVSDSFSNYWQYGYDSQGNRVDEAIHDSSSTKLFQRNYDFQGPVIPGRLWKIIEPDGDGTAETVLGYDDSGNTSSVLDQVGYTTGYLFDSLHRMQTIEQPGSVVTSYGYDRLDNLTSVLDANGNETSYLFDDLSRLLSQASPDSGTATFFYDLVSNQLTKSEADTISSIVAFDLLGRVTGKSFPGEPSQDYSFSYDEGVHGKGMLTGMVDPSGTTSYTYTNLGFLQQESKAVDQHTYSTIYGYTPSTVNLESITYPSNMMITYQRDSGGRVTGLQADGSALISNVHHLPFAGVQSYGFGNSQTYSRSHTLRYQVERIQSSGMDYNYKYYPDGLLWELTGAPEPILSNSSMTGSYQVGTNKIDTITIDQTVKTYSHDQRGNITSDGTKTFVYNHNNRLIQVRQNDTILADYEYDGFGRRVKKVTLQASTVYHYDQRSRLLAESSVDGTPLRDYIYLGEFCVAVKIYDGEQPGTYFVLNDHMGTPQKLVDSNGQTVWQIAYDPFFGNTTLTATVEFNLRFPGQYFDAETGLHYNWHRYYDPQTGRYLTPDPIGLEGGVNLFLYANADPINEGDPAGLSPRSNRRGTYQGIRNPYAEMEYSNLLRQLREIDPTYAVLRSNRPINWRDVNYLRDQLRNLRFGESSSCPKRFGNIPENWVVKPSRTGGGLRYIDPENPHNSVRIMPGDPNSPYPNSRQPYVRWLKNGQSLDTGGNVVPRDSPEAHIPLNHFQYF